MLPHADPSASIVSRMPTDDALQPTSPHRCALPPATTHRAGTIWECVDCGSRYRRVTRTGMQPNAMWDHDSMYRLRRALIVGLIALPVALVLVIAGAAMTRA